MHESKWNRVLILHLIVIEDAEDGIHFLVQHTLSDHEVIEERQLQDLLELLDREPKAIRDIIKGLPDIDHEFGRKVDDALAGSRH